MSSVRVVVTSVIAPGAQGEQQGVFAMSVAAELCGLHPQTLRAYERRGLISPQRTAGGTRRYSVADVAAVRRIVELSALGVSFEGIELVLNLEAQVRALQSELDAMRASVPPAGSGQRPRRTSRGG